ncbi:MAG: threonine synthase [Thaumarchaeota archaeon]|nr:threonine synthase [Nitrososphaerota archaeon]
MNASSFILRCMTHACEFPSDSHNLVCSNCGGPLEAVYDYEALRKAHHGVPADEKNRGVWRYSPLLPLNAGTGIVTLGEGATPLVDASRIAEALGLDKVYVKDDSRNPTLSFKDRKTTVAVSKAAEFGASGVANMTAGNAGSSVAAYAGKAGIPAYIFTIGGISDSKLAKLLSYGAMVFRTTAPTKELMTFVGDVAKKYGMVNMTAASRYNPYVKEGSKTSVFEIYEQMGGRLPDWMFIPIGGGGNLAGIFKGLRELKLLGLIETYPRIVGVQGKDCAPVVQAYEQGLPPDQIPVVENPRTIAHSILDSWAPDGDQALTAIRETGGLAMGVTDEELYQSMKTLSSQEGLYLEPASAAPLAALGRLMGDGTMGAEDSVVLFATGSGANQPDATLFAWGEPPIIELDLEGFVRYISK